MGGDERDHWTTTELHTADHAHQEWCKLLLRKREDCMSSREGSSRKALGLSVLRGFSYLLRYECYLEDTEDCVFLYLGHGIWIHPQPPSLVEGTEVLLREHLKPH